VILAINQFANKLRTHGVLKALLYSMEHLLWPLWRKVWLEPVLKSYSQRYEDLLVDRLLGLQKPGFYLDIGAFHPDDLSNTKRFFRKGWKGCNVEPIPVRFEAFLRERPGDVNCQLGISNKECCVEFFEMSPPEYSTFCQNRADELIRNGAVLRKKYQIQVIPLSELFGRYLDGIHVDFCSIDAEGLDLEVLEGNDWERYRPSCICVEVSLKREGVRSAEEFLTQVGYVKKAETKLFGNVLNQIFLDSHLLEYRPVPA